MLKANAPDAKTDDFIFGYGSQYLNLRSINSMLEYACLGHSNTTTTLGYIYNPLTPEESLSIMEKTFSN